MTLDIGNTDRLNVFRQEASRLGVKVLPPDINRSAADFSVERADDGKLAIRYALAAVKTTSKILNVLARAEAEEKGADEALLLNTNGEVAETAGGNLFWIYQDHVCTVPTGRGVLPGITRAVVLEICQTLGLETQKRIIKPEHLRNATGIFVTQSAFGIVPVAAFDGLPVAPSPLVDQIASAYDEMLRRE